MEAIARAAAAYFFLLLVFRICGRRTLARITSFELVLLLIIGGAIQQALLASDNSMTGAALVVLTLVALHAGFTALRRRWKGRRDRLRTD